MSRPRVVIAGLGDTGVLTAIGLARHADVVGISTKPGLVSGQELGVRLTRPHDWSPNYWVAFDRYRGLDGVRTEHATLIGLDLSARQLQARRADGSQLDLDFDALVISTGVSNGFWRRPDLQSTQETETALQADHERLASAESVIVIGGGAAAVSSAANIARTWPPKRVDLYFPGERALPSHHPRTWARLCRRLGDLGVGLHPGHRALVPDGFDCDAITGGAVAWSTGQLPASADAVLWAIGRVRPNTAWLPPELLDERGFVRVTPELRVPDHRGVFAIGDVAATDPLRNSARGRADRLLVHNLRAELAGRPLRSYRPKSRRWGSVLGVQPEGLDVFAPNGLMFRFPRWSIDRILQGWIVERGIYRGVRPGRTE
jgi:NADH dehydrogenase FAD-containing subunit